MQWQLLDRFCTGPNAGGSGTPAATFLGSTFLGLHLCEDAASFPTGDTPAFFAQLKTDESRLLVWGCLTRGLALVYAVSFLSLSWCQQTVALAGCQGVSPLIDKLNRIRADIPSPLSRWLRFPTLFWISATDETLRWVPIVGGAAAASAFYGGPWSPGLLFIAWIIYLSLDLPIGLKLPWDSLLLEVGFLAPWLPATMPLSFGVSACHMPPASLAWLFRWLLARVLLGFGKKKFVGTSSSHHCYIQGFLVGQPMPTKLGWLASQLPLAVHKFALITMFIIEIIVPWFFFASGTPRAVSGLSVIALMLGIQATGNFGYFNLLTSVLSLVCLDTASDVTDLAAWWIPGAPVASWVSAILTPCLAFLGCGTLLFDSWCSTSYMHWPNIVLLHSPVLQRLARLLRVITPFRIISSYGVFPPVSSPGVRWVVQIEGTQTPAADGAGSGDDGDNDTVWEPYYWKFMTSGAAGSAAAQPRFVAPHHPRIDHMIFYAAVGMNNSNMLASVTSGDPYGFCPAQSTLRRLVLRLLSGNSDVLSNAFFSHDPFRSSGRVPERIRAQLYAYHPTSLRRWRESGCRLWWERRLVGVHMAPVSLETENPPVMWPHPPELFLADHLPSWKSTSPVLATLMDGAVAPGSSTSDPAIQIPLSVNSVSDFFVTDDDVRKMFWSEFIDAFARDSSLHESWDGIRDVGRRLRSRFSADQLACIQIVYGRLRVSLTARLSTLYHDKHTGPAMRAWLCTSLGIATYDCLELLASHIIALGMDRFNEAMQAPERVAWEETQNLTLESGNLVAGILWLDMYIYHSRKFAIVKRVFYPQSSSQSASVKAAPDPEQINPLPGFFQWGPRWLASKPLQVALGTYRGQSLPLCLPPGPGGRWYVYMDRDAPDDCADAVSPDQ